MSAERWNFDPPLIERLGVTLLHSVWQLAAVTLIFSLVALLLRRRSAPARYVAACGALTVMAVVPAATFFALAPAFEPRGAEESSLLESAIAAPEFAASWAPEAAGQVAPPHDVGQGESAQPASVSPPTGTPREIRGT